MCCDGTVRRLKMATGPLSEKDLRQKLALIPLKFTCERVSVHIQLCEQGYAVVVPLFVLVASDMLQFKPGHFPK